MHVDLQRSLGLSGNIGSFVERELAQSEDLNGLPLPEGGLDSAASSTLPCRPEVTSRP